MSISRYNYRFNLSDRSNEQLDSYCAMLEDLSFHISTDLPSDQYKELSNLFYNVGVAVRLVKDDRAQVAWEKEKDSKRRKPKVVVPHFHKKMKKVVKIRK